MTSPTGSDTPDGPNRAASTGEASTSRLSIWERMRRAMADHNSQAPRAPMGMPQPAAGDDTADDAADTMTDETDRTDRTDGAVAADGATATLVLERIHHYRDTIRSYHVLIENKRVSQIRDDQTEHFSLPAGSYTLRLQLMWIFSPKVVIELPAGATKRLVCGPNGGILEAWRLFFAPTTAIFLRDAEEG